MLLSRIDGRSIPKDRSEIRLFAIARNEALRLPHFLKYYFNNGVDRIFLLDNNSNDDTVNIALSFKNVHVFKTSDEYKFHWFWMEYLLNMYGKHHWCLVVDIDELLYFPHAEFLSIRDLCVFLESSEYDSFKSLLLDMYSNKPIVETIYNPGENPLDVCPFFDKHYRTLEVKLFDRYKWIRFAAEVFTGGMRERVFGKNLPYYLSKISLFKNYPSTYLTQGMHGINGSKLADIQGVVFHTKFLQDFIEEVRTESIREQHFGNAVLYKVFYSYLMQTPEASFIYPDSLRYKDSNQLLQLGLMKSSDEFDKYVKHFVGNSMGRS